MNHLRVCLEIAKLGFETRAAYRMEVFLRLVRSLISVFALAAVWHALLTDADRVVGGSLITVPEMITYVILGEALWIVAGNDVLMRLDEKIKSGEIGVDLLKPLGPMWQLFCETVGANLFDVIFVLLPLIGIMMFGFGFTFPHGWTILLFLAAAFNGFLIYFLLAYLLGVTGFWYLEVWHLDRFLGDLVRLLSGAWIPLWFFPVFLLQVSAFLPFRLIYFAPLSIYLEKQSLATAISWIGQQVFWIFLLIVLEQLIWKRAVRKLVVQGG